MEFGILLGDEPSNSSPREHFELILRTVDAAQKAGITYIMIGQHFLYDGYRWLQPVPLLARLAAETEADVKLGTTIMIGPLYHPVILAEELATLDIIANGRLVIGIGTGYLEAEYEWLNVPYRERYARLEEMLELMPMLWSQERVTYHGRFWNLDDVPTHVRPMQQPRPPIWIGAMKEAGVRRAARLADAWTITPQQTIAEVTSLIRAYAEERIALGAPLRPLPLRRELMIGVDKDDAVRKFASVARGKYQAYSDRGMNLLEDEAIRSNFARTVEGHVILGNAQECRDQIAGIAAQLPIGPLMIRPHWPTMTSDQVDGYLAEVGREVIEPLRDLTPTSYASVLDS